MIERRWPRRAALRSRLRALAWLGSLAALPNACWEGDEAPAAAEHQAGAPSTDVEAGAVAGSGGAPTDEPPLYVVATAVSDDSGATTYVKLFSDFEPELDLKTAREFAGWSDIGVLGPYVFVSSGEGPTVQRFTIDEQNELADAGEISFGNYVEAADLYDQSLVSETKAYLSGEGEYVVWDPTALEITKTIPFPALPTRESVVPYFGLDRGAVVRERRLYHTVSWSDVDNLHLLPDSRIVVIDTESDQVVDVLTAACPDLGVAGRDEAGNLYFSNWVYTPGSTLLRDGAKACAVRIPAGREELDDWKLSYDAVNGHEGAALGYLGQGQWLFSSFRNDPAAYDPQTDWFDWLFGDHWQLEALDPTTLTSAPIKGVPPNGGGYLAQRFDGLTHVLIPGEAYASTSVYGIDANGTASKETTTRGWATRLFKLR